MQKRRVLRNIATPVVGELETRKVLLAIVHRQITVHVAADSENAQDVDVRFDSNGKPEKTELDTLERPTHVNVVVKFGHLFAELHRNRD